MSHFAEPVRALRRSSIFLVLFRSVVAPSKDKYELRFYNVEKYVDLATSPASAQTHGAFPHLTGKTTRRIRLDEFAWCSCCSCIIMYLHTISIHVPWTHALRYDLLGDGRTQPHVCTDGNVDGVANNLLPVGLLDPHPDPICPPALTL